jgi:hypothetical protein
MKAGEVAAKLGISERSVFRIAAQDRARAAEGRFGAKWQ